MLREAASSCVRSMPTAVKPRCAETAFVVRRAGSTKPVRESASRLKRRRAGSAPKSSRANLNTWFASRSRWSASACIRWSFLTTPRLWTWETRTSCCFARTPPPSTLNAAAVRLQKHPLFPRGTNVHVAAVDGSDRLRLRHWERGVGMTMACGTGAVAAAAAAIESRRVCSPVETLVPGGRLVVEWDGKGAAHLTGPAVRVFDTELRA